MLRGGGMGTPNTEAVRQLRAGISSSVMQDSGTVYDVSDVAAVDVAASAATMVLCTKCAAAWQDQ